MDLFINTVVYLEMYLPRREGGREGRREKEEKKQKTIKNKINKNKSRNPERRCRVEAVSSYQKKTVLMCHNKLSISTKIHFRAHNTSSSITNKGRGGWSQQDPLSTLNRALL